MRVDFWFSDTGLIEIKPVNGRTEENIYDGAYLSVEDTGFFDVEAETPDYSKGRYTVALSEENGTLLLTVNGLEMELSGISPDLFADGCYMTVSAMSVEGADYNEILITKVGDTSYVKGEEGGTPPTRSRRRQGGRKRRLQRLQRRGRICRIRRRGDRSRRGGGPDCVQKQKDESKQKTISFAVRIKRDGKNCPFLLFCAIIQIKRFEFFGKYSEWKAMW